MILLFGMLFYLISILYLWFQRSSGIVNPAFLWVLFQAVFSAGVFNLLDESIEADVVHAAILPTGIFLFVLGSLNADFMFRIKKQSVQQWLSGPPLHPSPESRSVILVLWIIVAVSLLASYLYYRSVGFHLLSDGVSSIASGEGSLKDAGSKRFSAYSGEQYHAPGYANQFKNILLPLLLTFFFLRERLFKPNPLLKKFLLFGILPLSLFFLTMTGQRSPLFFAIVVAIFFFRMCLSNRDSSKLALKLIIPFAVLFLLGSLALGRGGVTKIETTSDIVDLLVQLPERLFNANQASAVWGFRYIYVWPIEYGAEWWGLFLDILPGSGGMGLSSRLYAIYYGSPRGTSPPCIWGSIWHNFGLFGVIIVPYFMGIIYKSVFYRVVSRPKTLTRALIMAGVFPIMGMWVAGSPMWMVNVGLLTLGILGAIIKIVGSVEQALINRTRPQR